MVEGQSIVNQERGDEELRVYERELGGQDEIGFPSQQSKVIGEIICSSKPECEDLWCVLPLKWWQKWIKFTGFTAWNQFGSAKDEIIQKLELNNPGKIPTINLVVQRESVLEFEKIREVIIRNQTYAYVPIDVWQLLVGWYGVKGPVVKRPVSSYSGSGVNLHVIIDLEALNLRVALQSDLSFKARIIISKYSTAQMLKNKVAAELDADWMTSHLWDYRQGFVCRDLENDLSVTIEELALMEGQDILLDDVQEITGVTARGDILDVPYSNHNSYCKSMFEDVTNFMQGTQHGLAGLTNLGNTCYMNASLQCLLHTVPFLQYFLSNSYQQHINAGNPIGFKGELAYAFGALMHKLWQGNVQSVSLYLFKNQIAKFVPQFSGFAQHDCQELLAFLLDGLHEDLNRIVQKPYIEEKELDGVADEVAAQEAWQNYKKRNDSVVVHHFQYLIKSTLDCPNCRQQSVKFDPHMYLSLPIPADTTCFHEVQVITMDGSQPATKYSVELHSNSTVQQLYTQLAQLIAARTLDVAKTQQQLRICQLIYAIGSQANTDSLKILQGMAEPVPDLGYQDRFIAFLYPDGCLCAPGDDKIPQYFSSRRKLHPLFISGAFPLLMYCQKNMQGQEMLDSFTSLLNTVFRPNQKVDVNVQEMEQVEVRGRHEDVQNEKEENETSPLPLHKINGENSLQSKEKQKEEVCRKAFTIQRDFANADNFILEWDNSQTVFDLSSFFLHPIEHESVKQAQLKKAKPKEEILLSQCMETFLKPERLSDNDLWFCTKCKTHVRALKQLNIWSLPEVLVIHLKRFQYSGHFGKKISNFVKFPTVDLDLSEYIIGPTDSQQFPRYDLFAVCNHFGGLGGGHYTAYCRMPQNDEWYLFDDSFVAKEENSVVSDAAYVLFYRRQAERENDSESMIANLVGENVKVREVFDWGSDPTWEPMNICSSVSAWNSQDDTWANFCNNTVNNEDDSWANFYNNKVNNEEDIQDIFGTQMDAVNKKDK